MAQRQNSKTSRGGAPEKRKQTFSRYTFPLHRINYVIIAVSAMVIALGFLLIAGGGSQNGEFNPEIFSTTRIVIGPALAFLGFIALGVGIMWGGPGPKEKDAAGDGNQEQG